MKIGLDELRSFQVIAELRSFSSAAKMLGVSPSALSHMQKKMEQILNVRLLNRTTRSVSLTEAGEKFLANIQPALIGLDSAIQELISEEDTPRGTIKINCAESGAKLLIQNFFPDFFLKYPQIHIEFVIDTRFVDIVDSGFDAEMRLYNDVPQDMIAIKLGHDFKFVAVASPEYIARNGKPAYPQDLSKHQCIRSRFESGTLYLWEFENQENRFSIDVDGSMTLGNINLVLDAALAGIGIAWLPEPQVQEYIQSGQLINLLPQWGPDLSGFCLYYPSNPYPSKAFKFFTEELKNWAYQELYVKS